MTDTPENSPEPGQEDAASAANGEAEPQEPGPEAGTSAEPDYKALAAELNDRMLRAVAELENYRRRAEKERQDTSKYAISAFARDCLTVLDNLRRGLDTVTPEDRSADAALDALAQGMELTERELIATLERHGIVKVDPVGQAFDYDRHQAMFEVDDPSQPAGTVVQVVQPGYLLNDRLLRPAMVAVAKGGPKPADEPVAAPIANEDLAARPRPARGANDAGDKGELPENGEGPVDTKA
ncbi:MAG: nucleotide exchange factor GrpE [Alphaproteobacteria bacterium]|nr:nucleotide exchange factor GrpE [Alphaproteobacteria bacterium]